MHICGIVNEVTETEPKTIWNKLIQEAKLSLGKADRTAYVRSPVSNFQSRRESDFSEMAPFHARCVNETLLWKSTINASITQVARGDTPGDINRNSYSRG